VGSERARGRSHGIKVLDYVFPGLGVGVGVGGGTRYIRPYACRGSARDGWIDGMCRVPF
jgi:hypothetical protein